MNYFEHLNHAFSFAQFKNLPVSTRITHLAILHKWNAFRQPSSFSITDRELQSLTGLSSKNAITAAKRQLKNFGLIDFKSSKTGTVYFLPQGDRATFKASGGARSGAKSSPQAQFSTTHKVTNNKNKNEKNNAGEVDDEIISFSFDATKVNVAPTREKGKDLTDLPSRLQQFLASKKIQKIPEP